MRLRSIVAKDVAGNAIDGRRLSAARVQRTIARILKRNELCAIATVTNAGRAHINTAYFSYSDALELYFLSHPNALHCRNLHTSPTMAIAVFGSEQTWGELDRGLQLFGRCRATRGAAAETAERSYARRFKPYAAWKAELGPDDLAQEFRFYRFVTSQLKVFDERELGDAVFVTAIVARRT